jgi:hypothetical protein
MYTHRTCFSTLDQKEIAFQNRKVFCVPGLKRARKFYGALIWGSVTTALLSKMAGYFYLTDRIMPVKN